MSLVYVKSYARIVGLIEKACSLLNLPAPAMCVRNGVLESPGAFTFLICEFQDKLYDFSLSFFNPKNDDDNHESAEHNNIHLAVAEVVGHYAKLCLQDRLQGIDNTATAEESEARMI
jgi:hypothetical protein